MDLTNSSCCGCGACVNICNRKAIKMQANEEGFMYPVINNDVCINCELCTKVCPIIKSEEILHAPLFSYASWNKDSRKRFESSSGGTFSVIAEKVLAMGGVVYGASWCDGLKLKHIGVENKEDLKLLIGSKYLQSDMSFCFSEIKQKLQSNRWVCFCGTPCQVAGLKLFLRKDYEQLITIDFVCHGVPSQKIFDFFISDIEARNNLKLDQYQFRNKKINGWACNSSSSGLSVKSNKRKNLYFDKAMSSYQSAFMAGKISRESCYSCKFSQKNRCSDFTIGDYWGVKEVFPDMKNSSDGVSMLLVNTDKGKLLLDDVKNFIELIDSSYENIAIRNPNLNQSTRRPESRNDLKNVVFCSEYIKNNVPSSYYKDMLKFYIKRILRRS